ncbi:antibiotic biosynthesis monooxygenase family protein [Streptacidiphilus neutrinimicus]|uniref:antibiotic biosynthesis monooxygenase family protein n=1 Tax=Streptacidiphilus neutrinimicus TaxID=105420 RepID=UPI0005A7C0BD|nr:antibiotic biosynthesis monooxygenase [Streptacidiphilus neutrinimicus]
MLNWVLAEVNVSVGAEYEDRLVAAYHRLIALPLPDGLLQTELLRGEGGRWRIQTLWRDRSAMDAVRASPDGPAAPRLFRELNAEPEFEIFEVVDERITNVPEEPGSS